MTSVLGKRKSRTKSSQPTNSESEKNAQDVFQRYFEAQFNPLQVDRKSTKSRQRADTTGGQSVGPSEHIEGHREPDGSESESDDDSWSGVSSSASAASDSPSRSPTPEIEVVSHVDDVSKITRGPAAQKESKSFLSSRVPSSSAIESKSSSSTSKSRSQGATADNAATTEEDAPTLLKNDLALQRLLSESHLFSSQSASTGGDKSMEHTGRNRHLATDLRLQALGSRSSVFSQAKMPMSHRKGISAAATSRDAKRRRDARDNDIILERPGATAAATKTSNSSKKKAGGNRRERAVDLPAVGKMSHGMLKLSKRDVAEIENSGGRGGGGRRNTKGGGSSNKRRK